jgi:Cytochrome P460
LSFQKKSHPKSITESRTEHGEAPIQRKGRMLNISKVEGEHRMRGIAYLLGAVVALTSVVVWVAHASGQADGEAAPIYGVKIPAGYRDWKLIAVDQLLVPGKADQLRAQFGNDIAIKAFKEGTLPFPDGAIIAAIHWTRAPSEDNNKVLAGPFPGAESFVVGSPVNVQFMVKDSKKYAATGGWGFADFTGGKPGDKALHETCFPCHTPAKDRDYVFTRYAP